MEKRYTLTNALTLNATGNKYNAVAAPVSLPEIRRHAMHFSFNFSMLKQEGFIVYKICREGDEDIWQGLVGFRYSPGILDCANMETSNMNKSGMAL